jgi:dihydrofolate synthase/folylpolyglutamate synthase
MTAEPIEWLYGLQQLGVKLGLENIRALLERLGHPERDYRRITVGGTNGKGSVGAMLEAMLRRHGLRSGMFSSPHLVRPNERVRIDGIDVDDDTLFRLLRFLRSEIEAGLARGEFEAHPSFFETITATALTAFREAGVDVAVLEVGMGGRLDATNAAGGDLAVIVTVDFDHVKSLGSTLEAIAFEKGGIIRPGAPVVSGVMQDGPREVLRRLARERHATWVDARAETEVDMRGERFDVVTPVATYRNLGASLAGSHQAENAAVAVRALEVFLDLLGRRPDPDAVAAGLETTRWAGRLQWIPGQPALLLDCAHNPAGIERLSEFLDGWDGPRPVLVFSTTREKDLDRVLLPLRRHADAVVVARSSISRVMEPEEILAYAADRFARAELREEPGEALERAREIAGPGGVVLVTGSLYLVGNVLSALDPSSAPGPVPM